MPQIKGIELWKTKIVNVCMVLWGLIVCELYHMIWYNTNLPYLSLVPFLLVNVVVFSLTLVDLTIVIATLNEGVVVAEVVD